MKRRSILKSLGASAVAAVALPSWAHGWTQETLPKVSFFTKTEADVANTLVGAIIPEGETPGAASLGVDKFIEVMLKDCYGTKEQDAFKAGLKELEEAAMETFEKSFADCSSAQQQHLFEGLGVYDNADLRKFHGLVKYLTIRGYKHTEFYHNHTGFEFAPGRYIGCVELEKEAK